MSVCENVFQGAFSPVGKACLITICEWIRALTIRLPVLVCFSKGRNAVQAANQSVSPSVRLFIRMQKCHNACVKLRVSTHGIFNRSYWILGEQKKANQDGSCWNMGGGEGEEACSVCLQMIRQSLGTSVHRSRYLCGGKEDSKLYCSIKSGWW